MLVEKWRPVVGYEGYYEVSNLGRVRSLDRYRKSSYGSVSFIKGKVLKVYTQNLSGYDRKTVMLYKDNVKPKRYLISRLVAQAFPDICGEWFDGCVVDHINTISTDDRAVNLRVCTTKENVNNPITINRIRKERASHGKPVIQLNMDGEFIKEYTGLRPMEKETGYKHSFVSDCCKGRCNSAYGYKWRYKEEA